MTRKVKKETVVGLCVFNQPAKAFPDVLLGGVRAHAIVLENVHALPRGVKPQSSDQFFHIVYIIVGTEQLPSTLTRVVDADEESLGAGSCIGFHDHWHVQVDRA